MTRLFTALTLALVLVAPAFAQSTPEPATDTTPASSVSDEVLERHAGGYELQPGAILHITHADGILFAGVSDQIPYPMTTNSEMVFSVEAIGAEITFNRAPDGTTESLTLRQNGVTMTAGRVE